MSSALSLLLLPLVSAQLIPATADLAVLALSACADGTVDTTAIAGGSSVDLTSSLAVCFAAETSGVLELVGEGEAVVLTGVATTKEVALSVAGGATLVVRGTNDYLTNFTCAATGNVQVEAGASLTVGGSASIELSGSLTASSDSGTGTVGSSGNVLVLSGLTIDKNDSSTMDLDFYGSATLGSDLFVSADVHFHDDADAEDGEVTVNDGATATFSASLAGLSSISGDGSIVLTSGSGEAEVAADQTLTVGSLTAEAGAKLTLAAASTVDAALAVTSGAFVTVKGHAEATTVAATEATVYVEAAADADAEASLAVSGSCSFDTVLFELSEDAGDKVILVECAGGIDAAVDLSVEVHAEGHVHKRDEHEDEDHEAEYTIKVEGDAVVAYKEDHDHDAAASLSLSGALVAAVAYASM
eukprot:CAMPEP_0170747298 /NCGR_PEP_ID=MMETSP0437-20130122/9248_1 /TAXON_ID=0 /ORGANISM="Sexangularia sp." /LENGTH=414 /DNA_ID=CAMNT_0011086067 /DNA_START=110 /DNA_END=1354 /DNA_ORIENTATION=+